MSKYKERNLRMNTKCREQAYYGNPQSLFLLFDVCGLESSVLHFTPSFLFCFFKYCFLNKVIEIFGHFICCISSQNF